MTYKGFSDFIRNATTEEKREVYMEVMDKARMRQLKQMLDDQPVSTENRIAYFPEWDIFIYSDGTRVTAKEMAEGYVHKEKHED